MDRTEEYIKYNNLFDLYGNLLTENEKEIFILFYEEDLSLQEIASERGVSKSFIGKTIKTINNKLENYEKELKFYEKIIKLKLEINDEKINEKITEIMKG
jgi:hypothetical protein